MSVQSFHDKNGQKKSLSCLDNYKNRGDQQLCVCALSIAFQGSNKGTVDSTDIIKSYSPEICSTKGCCQILNLLEDIMP